MNFPTSPTNGQSVTVNNIVYVYSSAKNAWKRASSSVGDFSIGGNLTATGNITATINSNANTFYGSNFRYSNNVSILTGIDAANIGTLYLGNISTQSNLGAYQLYANANIGTLYLGNISTQANIGAFFNYANTKIGNNSNGNLVINTTTDSYSTTTGALVVKGGAGIAGNLWVGGNIYVANLISIASSTLSVQDPLLYLTASAISPYNYDIGFYSQFQGGSLNIYQHTGLARDASTATWGLFSNVKSEPGTTINWADAGLQWDTLKVGAINVANTTVSTSSSTGALVVRGGVGIAGAVNTGGNIATSGNITATGNITSTNNIIATGTISAVGNIITTGNLIVGNNIDLTDGYIFNVATPLASTDAATKGYVDSQLSAFSTTTISNGSAYVTTIDDGGFGNVEVSGNLYTGNIYTSTGGMYWSGNGSQFKPQLSIDDLTDVVISSPSTNQILKYNGTYWINGAAPGGGGGGTGITYTAGTSPPGGPNVADQWYDVNTDILYEYVDDGTTQYWVDIQSLGQIVGNITGLGNALLAGNVGVLVDKRYSIGTTGGALANVYTGNLYVGYGPGNAIVSTGNIVPGSNTIYNIGSSSLQFGNIWANSAVYINNSAITVTSGNLFVDGTQRTATYGDAQVNSLLTTLGISTSFPTYANTKIGTNSNSNLVVVSTATSTSTTTGAIVIGGGAGIAGNINTGGNITATGNITTTGNIVAGSFYSWVNRVTINLGTLPTFSNTVYVLDPRATIGSNITGTISGYTTSPTTVFGGDELEMDSFIVAANVVATGNIGFSITAVPGPVRGQRTLSYMLG